MNELLPAQRHSLLIVDDQIENLKILSSLLANQGFYIHTVSNSQQAFTLAIHESPSLILLDIRMPNMDGFGLCAQLKNNPQTQHIPIIFLSALDNTEDKLHAFDAGGVDYITKPFHAAEVLARIRTHLQICRMQEELTLRNQAMQLMEERLNLALEAAENGLWDITLYHGDPMRGRAYFSPRYCAMLGYPPNGLPGNLETWKNLVHPDDLSQVTQQIQAHISGSKAMFQAEYRMRHCQGHWIWVQARGKVVARDQDGNALRAIGIHVDITQRKKNEFCLRRETQVNAMLAELSQTLLGDTPVREMLLMIIAQARSLTASHDGVVGYISQDTGELVCLCEQGGDNLRLGEFTGLWGEALAYRKVRLYNHIEEEFAYTGLPGLPNLFIHNVLVAPVLHDEQCVGILALANRQGDYNPVDVALLQRLAFFSALAIRRYRDKKALLGSQARLHDAQRLAQLGAWTWEVCNDTLVCSDEMRRIYGGQVPTSWPEFLALIHPQDRAEVEQIFQRSLRQGIGVACDHRILLPNGDLRILHSISDVTTDSSGAAVRLNGIVQDVTQLKHAEEVLRRDQEQLERQVVARTQALEQANLRLRELAKMKDDFLAGMSHELRSPLNAILAGAEILSDELYGPLSPKQAKTIHRMAESSKHLLDLINDILDVSKIGAGKLELVWEESDPKALCDSAIDVIRDRAAQKKLHLETRYDPRAGRVRADPLRLKQILINLLNNAVKFTPARGSIGLILEADTQLQQLRFIVWDTGIGIDPEKIEQLFQPFVQLDSRLARNFEGTGLGLALVRELTDMHGGGVSVTSSLNQGATFTVAIPWKNQKLPEPSPPSPAAQTSQLSKILIAEDNEDNRQLLVEYLEAKEFIILQALDGAQAIQLARTEHPDIILMDIQMPGIDGIEATHRIRAYPELATTPIVALTALAMPGDQERCLAAGMNLYLTKPVVLRELVPRIRKLLAQR